MNTKLLLKTIFLMVVVLLIVLVGMHNRDTITFTLPPLMKQKINQPAAIMYSGFFAIGLLTGTILTAGGGGGGKRGGGGGSKSKD